MESKNAAVFVASVNKLTAHLERYGDANIHNLSLLKLIYKYACYSTTYAQLQRLDKMVSKLQIEDKFICTEKYAVSGTSSEFNLPVPNSPIGAGTINQPPTQADSAFTLQDPNDIYTFTVSDIFGGYNDPDGNLYSGFSIKTLPLNGTLKYNGVLVTVNTVYTSPLLLTYERNSDAAYSTSFTFTTFDNDSQLPLESNVATMSGTIEEITLSNQPATVGDRAQYAGNRVTTIFSVADFTTRAIAPYFDPENNDLDAIRIDEISDANTGTYYYYGAPVVTNQVITAADLDAGAFYHVAPDNNSTTTDSFRASVRDTGSMIWVQ